MTYPRVLSEDETLDQAIAGKCLARYGDGELSLALGGDCIFQVRNAVLANELRKILLRPRPNLLVCIPNCEAETKPSWRRYAGETYTRLYDPALTYGSAFVSRPDSAPWIDRPDYWEKLTGIWRGKDVTLVAGTDVSLRAAELGAASVRLVKGPGENAWAEIDRIDEEIGTPAGPVLLCLGPAATVLAWRLSRRSVHGLDMGHVGLYLRHTGAYAIGLDDVASPEYRALLRAVHARETWGEHGASHALIVSAWARDLNARSVLDYGCGTATLPSALHARNAALKVQIYDPGRGQTHWPPKPADLIVATDVLEHVEPDKIRTVLRHIFLLAVKGAFFSISCEPAKERLPDGRNAHICLLTPEAWLSLIAELPWTIEKTDRKKGVRVWIRK